MSHQRQCKHNANWTKPWLKKKTTASSAQHRQHVWYCGISKIRSQSWSSPWSDHIWAESERDDILFCGTSMELRFMHEYMSSQRNSWKYIWTAFRSYQQSTSHRPHKLPCHRPHAVAAILNSDSKMPASTGQYGSQCGSITMRYSIIHSQCWLSIATYKYLRTRQWHLSRGISHIQIFEDTAICAASLSRDVANAPPCVPSCAGLGWWVQKAEHAFEWWWWWWLMKIKIVKNPECITRWDGGSCKERPPLAAGSD